MEFKSQICTTVEQSKRLLELGLKKDTADMWHYKDEYGWRCSPYTEIWDEKAYLEFGTPAWSLHRLMEILHKGDIHGVVTTDVHNGNIESLYKLVIAKIEYLVKIKHFDIQFLEEKK